MTPTHYNLPNHFYKMSKIKPSIKYFSYYFDILTLPRNRSNIHINSLKSKTTTIKRHDIASSFSYAGLITKYNFFTIFPTFSVAQRWMIKKSKISFGQCAGLITLQSSNLTSKSTSLSQLLLTYSQIARKNWQIKDCIIFHKA